MNRPQHFVPSQIADLLCMPRKGQDMTEQGSDALVKKGSLEKKKGKKSSDRPPQSAQEETWENDLLSQPENKKRYG